MINKQITQFGYYVRLRKHMEINQNIWKENVEIKNTFNKLKTPLWKRLQEKLQQNKKKLRMFAAMLLICKMNFIYQLWLGTLPYKHLLFNQIKAYCLGLESVYPQGVIEQMFNSILSDDLVEVIVEVDEELPLGFTRKLLIRSLRECQINLSKEERRNFYNASGMINIVYGKMSGLNLKEINYILSKQSHISQEKLKEAILNCKKQEFLWQNQVIQRVKNTSLKYKENSLESIQRRIKPGCDKLDAVL